jgi:hypothetical protein
MRTALYLMTALAVLDAFDTLYYHEWKAKLPAMGRGAAAELRLHALCDFAYALLFSALPWLAWRSWYAVCIGALLLAEIVLTLWDFVVEDWIRKPLGGLYPGERVMHAIMGIVYGAVIAYLLPELRAWWSAQTKIVLSAPPIGVSIRWILTAMAVGVLASGVRDWLASAEVTRSARPWK